MSGCYPFTTNNNFEQENAMGSTVLVEESIVWDQENCEDQVIQYGDTTTNVTFTEDMSEDYVMANETNDTTQYFSVLETTQDEEVMFHDIDMSLTNPKVERTDTPTSQYEVQVEGSDVEETIVEPNDSQIVLYSIEGADELYGVQMAEDENGVLRKYQFTVRQNEMGQLEAIPESIQILPPDNDEVQATQPDNTFTTSNTSNTNALDEPVIPTLKIFVKDGCEGEEILPDLAEEDSNDHDLEVNEEEIDATLEDQIDMEQIDMKPVIAEMKQENCTDILDSNYVFSDKETEEEDKNETVQDKQLEETSEDFIENEKSKLQENEQTLIITNDGEIQEQTVNDNSVEYFEENINENDSDNEEYQIVEGLHITGDVEVENTQFEMAAQNYEINNKGVLHTHIIKAPHQQNTSVNNTKEISFKRILTASDENQPNKNVYYYVIKQTEKENVPKMNKNFKKLQKVNPRSILKTSHTSLVEKKMQQQVEKLDKRLANSKEVTQARMFHNYIAGTTILHAPIRQERLPRKQKIKPVERQDEEIIVEEVVVSSNGFIEPAEGRVPQSEPIACVNLSDSDDDYDPKKIYQRGKRKPRRRRSRREISISDSDDESNASVIELDSSSSSSSPSPTSDEEIEEEDVEEIRNEKEEVVTVKRGRGRPRKTANISNEETINDTTKDLNSPIAKRRRGRPPKVQKNEQLNNKNEINCTKCKKTFPSQGSLRTHMQYHNFRESGFNKESWLKYKCDDCDKAFRNKLLLSRHLSVHYSFECNICKKRFKEKIDFGQHKRSHIKDNMFKTTSAVMVTPSKLKTINRSEVALPPEKNFRYKCTDCGKVFSTLILLNAHARMHKHYLCSGCLATFTSKTNLNNHQKSCVKKKLSKSFTPKLALSIKQPVANSNNKQKLDFTCENCPMKFNTKKNLLNHKLSEHSPKNYGKKLRSRKEL